MQKSEEEEAHRIEVSVWKVGNTESKGETAQWIWQKDEWKGCIEFATHRQANGL